MNIIEQYKSIIDDQYLKFFMLDYFLDSKILSIQKNQEDISIEIEAFDYLSNLQNKNYSYKKIKLNLLFKNCKYISCSNLIDKSEYFGFWTRNIFKNSLLKSQLENLYRCNFFQLAIQTTLGYIELIFETFCVYDYITKSLFERNVEFSFDKSLTSKTNDEIISMIQNQYFNKDNAFLYLVLKRNCVPIDLIRDILLYGTKTQTYDDIWFLSLSILCENKAPENKMFLRNLYINYLNKINYLNSDDLFVLSQIKDAIDLQY